MLVTFLHVTWTRQGRGENPEMDRLQPAQTILMANHTALLPHTVVGSHEVEAEVTLHPAEAVLGELT